MEKEIVLKQSWIRMLDISRLAYRERVLLIATVVVILFAVWSYLYLPKYRQAREARTQINLAQGEIAKLSTQLPEMQKKAEELRLVRQKSRAGGSSSKIGDLMPGGSRLSSLLEEMTRLARLRRVEVISIRPEAIEDRGNYLELSLRIDVKSRFRELGDYLLMLENLPRAIRIKEVKMETNASIGPDILAHLQALTYIGKE
jgi:Tfp pilus assembly protein PilO